MWDKGAGGDNVRGSEELGHSSKRNEGRAGCGKLLSLKALKGQWEGGFDGRLANTT